MCVVCVFVRAPGCMGWETGQPGNRLRFQAAIMKTCNAWPADYTKQIVRNCMQKFDIKKVVGINCEIIAAPIVHSQCCTCKL